jgi:hypothetical protein
MQGLPGSHCSPQCDAEVEVGEDTTSDGTRQCRGATGDHLGGGLSGREQAAAEEWARLKRMGEHDLELMARGSKWPGGGGVGEVDGGGGSGGMRELGLG